MTTRSRLGKNTPRPLDDAERAHFVPWKIWKELVWSDFLTDEYQTFRCTTTPITTWRGVCVPRATTDDPASYDVVVVVVARQTNFSNAHRIDEHNEEQGIAGNIDRDSKFYVPCY